MMVMVAVPSRCHPSGSSRVISAGSRVVVVAMSSTQVIIIVNIVGVVS